MEKDIERVLITQEDLQKKIKEMGERIAKDYEGKELLVVGILKGSCVFMSDLIRNINLPLSIDFMYVSSYGSKTVSSGSVKIIKDLDENIEGKHVLIAEDVLDSGISLSRVLEILKQRKPASLKIAALLNKPDRRLHQVDLDYEGFVIPDEFVVGFGLDYAQKYRNLPYVGILKRSVYENE